MHTIEVSIITKENRKKIYKLLKNIEAFPKFIKNIKRIQIIKHFAHRLVADWEVLVDGALIKWREEELFDNVGYLLRFKMLEGDYNKYEGEWQLLPLLNGTKLILSVNIDWGAPALVGFPEVKKILIRKTKKALKSMLIAIKRKVENSL